MSYELLDEVTLLDNNTGRVFTLKPHRIRVAGSDKNSFDISMIDFDAISNDGKEELIPFTEVSNLCDYYDEYLL